MLIKYGMKSIFGGIAKQFFSSSNHSSSKIQKGKHLIGNINDLADGQMKEANLIISDKPQKVLLSRINGKYYATTHLCTHYKARLVTGVLTEEGRVVCPWHGACFNVATGDIEEAPALEALKCFDIVTENDSVYIFADASDFMTSSQPACKRTVEADMDGRRMVIVGGGPAASVAAESLRVAGFQGRIIVISKEPHLPIDRIKLSKVLHANVENLLLYQPDYLNKLKIEYELSKKVQSLDIQNKKVELSDGRSIGYDKLLIATGGEPRTLSIPGADLKNIFTIRHIENNHAILSGNFSHFIEYFHL